MKLNLTESELNKIVEMEKSNDELRATLAEECVNAAETLQKLAKQLKPNKIYTPTIENLKRLQQDALSNEADEQSRYDYAHSIDRVRIEADRDRYLSFEADICLFQDETRRTFVASYPGVFEDGAEE